MPDPSPPPRWPIFAALAVAAIAQKFANNFEGLTKVAVRSTLERPESAGGLGLSTAEAGAFLTACALGYTVKPLFGVVTDRLPLFGYRRKSWLVAASLATAAAWALVASTGFGAFGPLLVGLMLVNVTVTFADVVCDGVMVESGQRAEAAGVARPGAGSVPYQTAQWAASLAALLVAVLAGGALAVSVPPGRLAWACAGVPLVAAVAALALIRENRVRAGAGDARAGLVAAGLALGVGAAVFALKLVSRGTPFAPFEPYLSPLLVVGAVLTLVRVPASLLAPLVLIVLWPAIPLKADSQYFFSYLTDPAGPVARQLGEPGGVAGAFFAFAAWLGVPGALDPAARPALFAGTAVLGAEVAAGLVAVALLGRLGARRSRRSLLNGFLAVWALAAVGYFALARQPSPGLAVACAALGGVALWGGGTAVLFYAAAQVPAAGARQATTFALLMGLSNLGGLFGVETVGAKVYELGGGLGPGLHAVVGLTLAHLILLAAVVTWLARRRQV